MSLVRVGRRQQTFCPIPGLVERLLNLRCSGEDVLIAQAARRYLAKATDPGQRPRAFCAVAAAEFLIGAIAPRFVPRRVTVAVPGRVPESPIETIRLVSRSASTKRLNEGLRPAEVALFEVLRDWDRYVGEPASEAFNRIGRLIESGAIRVARVVAASQSEPPRSRSRLRALLQALGLEDSAEGVPPARNRQLSEPRAV